MISHRARDKKPCCLALIVLFILLATACQQRESADPIARQTAAASRLPIQPAQTPTFTPVFTPTPSRTPTATPTPTITPTPTPTAHPITIAGEDWRESRIGPPVSSGNAPCGVVDLLDFPLDPPEGISASGGGDFGRFRSRYDKFHAGEDWWGVRGRQSFGEPVYSIGHGLVTYAEPEGWNRDKGVIIIQHTFADGSVFAGDKEFLSFYGHLDPPSVLLNPGDCVERGQQIGQIGRPLSSPHLHFEIRTQAPYQTLTGYWPEDPSLVGWLPPSAFIWSQRIRSSPGVLWAKPDALPYAFEDNEYVGLFNSDSLIAETIITLQSLQLTGINLQDGRQLWQLESEETGSVYSALIDERLPIVYIADRSGRIQALSLSGGAADPTVPSLQPLWELELDVFGRTNLLPLVGGGLLIAVNDRLWAVSSEGLMLWETEAVGGSIPWARLDDGLLLSVAGANGFMGTADAAGLDIWETAEDWPENSIPVTAGSRIWLYNREGLYQLSLESGTAELHYTLPRGLASLGDVVGLPDGGLLLAHADTADRRLLAFNSDGSLRWERSYESFISGSVRLVEQNGRVYLMNDENNTVTLYAVDLNNAVLNQIFIGGTRSDNLGDSWVETAEDYLIISIAGGNMVALDNPR
jgi:murein DD-endopeptidase MepM/ murein hydrolase activator NlpD